MIFSLLTKLEKTAEMKCSESAELLPGGGKFLYYSVQLNSLQLNLFQDKMTELSKNWHV